MDEALTRSALVERARRGDADAFETIVRCRMPAVYRLCLAILADDADAADAAQETFIAAWRELPRLRDVGRFEPWLQRIAVNACRMALRARGRRAVREIPGDAVQRLAIGLPPPVQDDAAVLGAALRRLPADERSILALHHLEGQPLAELAAALGIPVGTAKSRLSHARAALARALESEARR
ncbi:MAG TPA: sigma-70 family RNA polymerase sigma factor [Candidatus Limnocylindrales bacterium]